MRKLSYKQMVTAFQGNDKSYDGRFYVGVHTTGIYCLPSCKAKLPKLENITFFASREESIAAGLRGCKRCRSEFYPNTLPQWLYDLLRFMRENRNIRLTEDKLIKMTSVDITTARRHFKEHLGMTPLGFHRKLRLNYARELIKSGSSYLEAAFESGYESSSGFREAFEKAFGYTPGNSK